MGEFIKIAVLRFSDSSNALNILDIQTGEILGCINYDQLLELLNGKNDFTYVSLPIDDNNFNYVEVEN